MGFEKYTHARVAGQELGLGPLKQGLASGFGQSVDLGVYPVALVFLCQKLGQVLLGDSLCQRRFRFWRTFVVAAVSNHEGLGESLQPRNIEPQRILDLAAGLVDYCVGVFNLVHNGLARR